MLLKADVANELKKIGDALRAARPSVLGVQAVADLLSKRQEIEQLKASLITQLKSLVSAIDSGEPPALANISDLLEHVKKAIQELEAGGQGAGVSDNVP